MQSSLTTAAGNFHSWPEEQGQNLNAFSVPRTLPNRACAECRRKKSKCDMKRPECSLCHRIGETCVYPTRRAQGRKRTTAQQNAQAKQPDMGCYPSPSNSQENTLSHLQIASDWPSETQSDVLDSILQENIFSPRISPSPDPFLGNDSLLPMDIEISDTTLEQLCTFSTVDDLAQWSEDQRPIGNITPLPGMQGAQSTSGDELTPAAVSMTQPGCSNTAKKKSTLPHDSGYILSVSPNTALDLIDGFFDKIHCFLPLFHPARFKEKYASLTYLRGEQNGGLSLESALILNGMFCLSARFSTASAFSDKEPVHRGDQFVAEATRLFDLIFKHLGEDRPSLACLQGVILLNFSALLLGPSRQAWWLTGVCARLAHELGLHRTDADIICGDVDSQQLSLEAWQDREERRRAWWIVWDMDTFASATMMRPFAISLLGIQVLLPISDEAWLASKRIPSPHLDPESTTPWKGLCDSPNQSPWAWFLACTVILRQVIEIRLSPTTDRVLDRVEASVRCFALALPENFRADLDSTRSDGTHFKDVNWVMATLLMFNWYAMNPNSGFSSNQVFKANVPGWSAEMNLALHRKRLSASNTLHGQISRNDSFPSFPNSPTPFKNYSCDSFERDIAQVARAWPTQNLAQATPFIAICLVGPAVVHVRNNKQRNSDSLDDLNDEILIFALKRLARHWMIANVLLDDLGQFQKNEKTATSEPTIQERKACHHWSSLVL